MNTGGGKDPSRRVRLTIFEEEEEESNKNEHLGRQGHQKGSYHHFLI